MTAIVAVETVLLVLLVVLVAGLLRSHAEILRRLGPAGEAPENALPENALPVNGLPDPPRAARRPDEIRAAPLTGTTPAGDPLTLSFDGVQSTPTLLAFLTTGCATCAGFWESLADERLPSGIQTVIVAHGADRERPARLRELAPDRVPVVMSSQAWSDYRVPGSPYFVLVDGVIRGEGVAGTWDALASLVSDAVADDRVDAGTMRARQVEDTLAAAGIGPDHPSLYPGGRDSAR
jgi:hypothetical protein